MLLIELSINKTITKLFASNTMRLALPGARSAMCKANIDYVFGRSDFDLLVSSGTEVQRYETGGADRRGKEETKSRK